MNQALNGPLGQVESGHAHIFSEHGFAHVQGDHDVHPIAFDFFHAGAPFGIHHADGEQGQCRSPHEEFPHVTARSGSRPKGFGQRQVGHIRHALLLPEVVSRKEQQPDRRNQQGGPSRAHLQVQLGRHLPEEQGKAHHRHPEGNLKQHEPRHVGKDLVAPRGHGNERNNT